MQQTQKSMVRVKFRPPRLAYILDASCPQALRMYRNMVIYMEIRSCMRRSKLPSVSIVSFLKPHWSIIGADQRYVHGNECSTCETRCMQVTSLYPIHHVLLYQPSGSGTTIRVQQDLARRPWLCTLQVPWVVIMVSKWVGSLVQRIS